LKSGSTLYTVTRTSVPRKLNKSINIFKQHSPAASQNMLALLLQTTSHWVHSFS